MRDPVARGKPVSSRDPLGRMSKWLLQAANCVAVALAAYAFVALLDPSWLTPHRPVPARATPLTRVRQFQHHESPSTSASQPRGFRVVEIGDTSPFQEDGDEVSWSMTVMNYRPGKSLDLQEVITGRRPAADILFLERFADLYRRSDHVPE